MKALPALLSALLFSMSCHAQEQGRVYLDHMSIAPPAGWELQAWSSSITLTAPLRVATLYQRCTIQINVAGSFAGGPLALMAVVDGNVPGNLEKQNMAPVRTLDNGWSVAERLYRNRYVDISNRAVVITKNGAGQVLMVGNDLSGCAAITDPVLRTLRTHDQALRLQASGAPLTLMPPPRQESGADGGRTRAGTVCRAGGITCLNGGAVGSTCMCASTAGPQMGTVF